MRWIDNMSNQRTVIVSNVIKHKDSFLLGRKRCTGKIFLPGGKVEESEILENTFWRELEEETNLKKPKDFNLRKLSYLGLFEFIKKKEHFLVLYFLSNYHGQMGYVHNNEPEKCSELFWESWKDSIKRPIEDFNYRTAYFYQKIIKEMEL